MVNLLALIFILISLGTITFIVAKKIFLKEINPFSFNSSKRASSEVAFLGKSLDEWDEVSKNFLIFFLRKIKIFSLKVDNQVSKWLKKLTPENSQLNFPFEKLNSKKRKNKPA